MPCQLRGQISPDPVPRRASFDTSDSRTTGVHWARRRRPAREAKGTLMTDASRQYPVQRSDDEWRETLGADEFQILRRAATERAGTGELLDEERDGIYRCGACKSELFISGTKFDSGCGWPSFYESIRPEAVELLDDIDSRVA